MDGLARMPVCRPPTGTVEVMTSGATTSGVATSGVATSEVTTSGVSVVIGGDDADLGSVMAEIERLEVLATDLDSRLDLAGQATAANRGRPIDLRDDVAP